jgi:hypothetical protein
MARGIGDLLSDPERAQQGRDGRAYVLEHCTWEQQAEKWEELLYRVVSRVRGETIPRMHGVPTEGA